MIAKTRSYIFWWRSRCCRPSVRLNSLLAWEVIALPLSFLKLLNQGLGTELCWCYMRVRILSVLSMRCLKAWFLLLFLSVTVRLELVRHFFIQRLFVASFTFLRTKFCEINPTNTVGFSPEPRAEIHCLHLNFKILKLAYSAGRKKNPHSVQKDKGLTLLLHCQKLVRLNK